MTPSSSHSPKQRYSRSAITEEGKVSDLEVKGGFRATWGGGEDAGQPSMDLQRQIGRKCCDFPNKKKEEKEEEELLARGIATHPL